MNFATILNNSNRLYFTRHCATKWSENKILQGKSDIELSENGLTEAKEKFTKLNKTQFDLIITSHLKRSCQTATIYSKELNIPFEIVTGLEEIDHGSWEGSSFEKLESNLSYSNWLKDPSMYFIPDGKETISEAVNRFETSILETVGKYSKGKILFVTHKHIFGLFISSRILNDFKKFKESRYLDTTPLLFTDCIEI